MISSNNASKLNVLMIGPDRSVHGGISAVVNNLFDAGLDKMVNLTYIGTMKDGSRFRKLLVAIKAYLQFCRAVKHCDIVHVHFSSDASFWRKSLFIRKAYRVGKPIVLHQHGGDFRTFYIHDLNNKQRTYVRNTLNMGSVMLVINPELHELFKKKVLLDKLPTLIFPNAIQIPSETVKKYGQHQLLFLGRICRDKGVQELLEAVRQLKGQYPSLHLYLGGSFEDSDLKRLVDSMSDCVTWIGWVSGEDKANWLKKCDIFVLPSYFEGQSVSILEAMSYSCAIAASNVGGIPQMILNGQTGLLFEPKSTASIEETLQKLLDDPALCRNLGKAARKRVSSQFSMDKYIHKLLSIYKTTVMQSRQTD